MQKKSLFKNTIYKSILSFANIIIPIIIGPYVANLLDVEKYGIYNAVYAEFQIFFTFASFGIYTFGIREISKIRDDKKKISKLFSNLFVISILANFIVSAIYIIYSLLTSSGLALNIYMIFLIQFLGNVFYIEYLNEALENFKFITIKTIIVKILYIILIFLMVRNPEDVVKYAIVVSIIVFLNNILSYIYAKGKIKFDFKKIEIKKYLKPLFIILVISNVDLLYGQLDKVLLGRVVKGASVTIYYIPYYLIATITTIAYSVINVSIPRLSYVIENEGKKEYEKVLTKSISALLFLIIPLCFGVFVLSKEVMLIYAGKKYLSAIPVLALACIIRIIISCQSVMTNLVMYPNNKEQKILKFSFIFGVTNLIMNFMLIKINKFTPFTSMATTGINIFLVTLVSYIYATKKLKLKINFITKQNLLYLLLGVLFIPISVIVKLIDFGFLYNILIIMTLCCALYVGILFVKKDENLFIIINKFFNRFKRSKKI